MPARSTPPIPSNHAPALESLLTRAPAAFAPRSAGGHHHGLCQSQADGRPPPPTWTASHARPRLRRYNRRTFALRARLRDAALTLFSRCGAAGAAPSLPPRGPQPFHFWGDVKTNLAFPSRDSDLHAHGARPSLPAEGFQRTPDRHRADCEPVAVGEGDLGLASGPRSKSCARPLQPQPTSSTTASSSASLDPLRPEGRRPPAPPKAAFRPGRSARVSRS